MNATGNRHQSRADWHDYCDGVYFVTICSPDKKHIFGEIAEGEMRLSELGRIAADCLHEIPAHHPDAEIISQVVMPNHLHIIIAITRPAIGNLGIVGHPLPPYHRRHPCHPRFCYSRPCTDAIYRVLIRRINYRIPQCRINYRQIKYPRLPQTAETR